MNKSAKEKKQTAKDIANEYNDLILAAEKHLSTSKERARAKNAVEKRMGDFYLEISKIVNKHSANAYDVTAILSILLHRILLNADGKDKGNITEVLMPELYEISGACYEIAIKEELSKINKTSKKAKK